MTTFADVSSGRDNNFNLIRMAAAIGVLVSHSYPISLGPQAQQPLQQWLDGTTLGSVSVLVFFAISGFFITKSFDQSVDWRRFVRARAYRLFPALITVTFMTILVAGTLLSTAESSVYWSAAPAYFVRNVTMAIPLYVLPGVFTGNPYGPAINGSLWTLAYEVSCYFGVFLFGMAGLLRRVPQILFFLLLFMALSVADQMMVFPGRVSNAINLGMPFATGGAIYLWRRHIPFTPLIAAALAAGAFLAQGTAVFSLMFAMALSYTTLWLGFSRWQPALLYNRLGDYSYGTYIFAFPIQQTLAGSGVASPLVNMSVAIPATCLCAALSWHFVERPALTRVHHTS